MLGRQKFQGGFKNGELYALANETYFGGQPASMSSGGDLVLCTTSNVTGYVGIFANDSAVDGVTATARAQATYYGGGGIFTLQANSDGNFPYNDALTYVPQELLYVGASLGWTNVDPGSAQARAKVLSVSTNSITIQLFDQI